MTSNDTVECSAAFCAPKWYPVHCVSLTVTMDQVPDGDWYCLDCQDDQYDLNSELSYNESQEIMCKMWDQDVDG